MVAAGWGTHHTDAAAAKPLNLAGLGTINADPNAAAAKAARLGLAAQPRPGERDLGSVRGPVPRGTGRAEG